MQERFVTLSMVSSRRDFLRRAGGGLGWLAASSLLADELRAGERSSKETVGPLLGRQHNARARSVIWLFLYGGPSAIDLFDPKSELERMDGKKPPEGIDTFFSDNGNLMRSPYRFARHGQCGAWVSEKHPMLARCVDDLAFLKSVHCESNNHAPALFHLNTGMARVGFPSVGAWTTYGLSSVNRDLPGFIVMYDHRGGPIGGPQNWGSGFLPSRFQGTPFRASGSPILNLERPADLSDAAQRAQLDLLSDLNAEHLNARPNEPDLEARVQSYELAYRMQSAAPEAIDIGSEPEETRRLYGLDRKTTQYFGAQCLVARRLVERGVRFIQIYSGGGHQQDSWDAHFGLKPNHDLHCEEIDQPVYGLLTDLKRRGMLDSTLVIWGGEFGRMPMSQGENQGRDHNPDGFSMWMSGGGVKGGVSHGETDEIGHRAVVNPVSVNDLHATILHLLGIDHEQLTYFHNGRHFRLTDVAGKVVHPILA